MTALAHTGPRASSISSNVHIIFSNPRPFPQATGLRAPVLINEKSSISYGSGFRHLNSPAYKNSSRTAVVAASAGGGRGFGKDYSLQDEVKAQRTQQIMATDLLAKLLQAGDGATAVAEEYIDSLSEEFFHIGSAYLKLSEKEGDEAVTSKLREALQAAMKVKQSTLRLEIQLLNKLLAAGTPLERKQVLNTKDAGEQLVMNDKYFFTLLSRMTSDVTMQPEGPAKDALLAQLVDIKADALGRLPPGA